MGQTFEVIFTEKVRSIVYIEADSPEHAQNLFNDGNYEGHKAKELDSWDAETKTIKELEDSYQLLVDNLK